MNNAQLQAMRAMYDETFNNITKVVQQKYQIVVNGEVKMFDLRWARAEEFSRCYENAKIERMK